MSCAAVDTNPAPRLTLYQYISIDERTREPTGCPNQVGLKRTPIGTNHSATGGEAPSRWCKLRQSSTGSLVYSLPEMHVTDFGEYLCEATYEHNQTEHFEPLRSFALLLSSDMPLRIFAPPNQTLDAGTGVMFIHFFYSEGISDDGDECNF